MTRRSKHGSAGWMAVPVFGLGAAMAAAGAAMMAYGYGYISVEQGWSAFIAGSVLLTGGLVALALGLVVRALGELRAALLQQAPSEPREASFEPAAPPPGEPGFGPRDEPSFVVPQPFDHAHDETLPPALPAMTEPPYQHARETAEDKATAGEVPLPADWLDRSFAALDRGFAELRPGFHEEPTAVEALPRDDAPIHADPPPEPAKPGDPFAESPAEVAPARVEAGAVLEPPHPTAHAADALAPDEPPATDAKPVASVIGRYESDGTSYVMFADGSIEAHSEAGVYRFASMTELKAFIEG